MGSPRRLGDGARPSRSASKQARNCDKTSDPTTHPSFLHRTEMKSKSTRMPYPV